MPLPDPDVISRASQIAARLEQPVPGSVITEEVRHRPYDMDAFTAYRQLPLIVELPSSTEEVAAAMRACRELKL